MTRRIAGRALSPAKINDGLAILGRRPDGFHDLHTVMHAVTLFDRITMLAPGTGIVDSDDPLLVAESNVMTQAAREISARVERQLEVDFVLEKRIPVAAGLGGGSSNAAAVLRLLSAFWRLSNDDARVHEAAAATGSDVPFFLTGGTALVTGRGEHVEPLSAGERQWVVIATPTVSIPNKTATLFRLLNRSDFTTLSALKLGEEQRDNAFSRPLYQLAPDLQALCTELQRETTLPVRLSGAGPSHYVMFDSLREASAFLRRLRKVAALRNCVLRLARTMQGAGPLDMTGNGGQ